MPSPVLLVTVEEFLDATGQDAELFADATKSIEGAIIRATQRLGGSIRSDLYRARYEDLFYCDSYAMAPLNKRHRFQLSTGLLREDMEPVVETSDSPHGSFSTLSGNFYDYKKGLVTCDAESVKDLHVRVSYEAGFESPAELQDPLRQAILLLSPLMVLSSISTSLEPKQQAAATAKAKSLEAMAEDVVVPYMRNRGGWFQPMHTLRVDTMPTPAPAPAPGP